MQTFARYLAYKRDNNELLFFLLRQLAHEQTVYLRNRFDTEPDTVDIPETDLADRVSTTSPTLITTLFITLPVNQTIFSSFFIVSTLLVLLLAFSLDLSLAFEFFLLVAVSDEFCLTFVRQARQINITNLKPFFDSDIFKANRFSYDAKKKLIVQTL